jgi:hypothetical protein
VKYEVHVTSVVVQRFVLEAETPLEAAVKAAYDDEGRTDGPPKELEVMEAVVDFENGGRTFSGRELHDAWTSS